ncbi:RNA polymerase sigma-70 factor [Parabacteroides faecis]|uniref:RNA polymerase sigma-70 factor (ECF subfamily) n=1 Tax=Parabacteroides faecis TaxID=1217282 RepID=A0ABR6KMV1_9BACT|nr:RNA polymerase sigma-70 factor [Parabacteroides faecis]MBB4622832.1 RNA polymerase sigma-70 factor (ECF subfamily) [Parabacteroides faecis]GGJ94593.1 DNA-directed RNA polymerase sigma-70 factor [Parabacteroides faecis]
MQTIGRNQYDKEENGLGELMLFQELFERYFRSLVTYAYRYVNDWNVSEDIVQDVFMALWVNRNEIDFEEPVKPYLYRATYNRSINHLNSVLVQRRVDHADNLDELIDYEILSYNQHDNLLLKEIEEEISSFVKTLPEQRKKVFLLSREENMKNKEIAFLLNISEKTVEKHITKALSDIRTHLTQTGLMSGLIYFLLNQN